jgi:hypothetical protein
MASRLALSAPGSVSLLILIPELTPDFLLIQQVGSVLRTPIVIFLSSEDKELLHHPLAQELTDNGMIEPQYIEVESTMRSGLVRILPFLIDYMEGMRDLGA